MAKAQEEESTRLSALNGQIVGSFEISSIEAKQKIPLHFMAGAQDHSFAEATALSY
jgi:hypothetical protein